MSSPAVTAPEQRSAKASTTEKQSQEVISLPWLVVRILWVAVELILAYWFALQAQPFFYQRF
jgi:hypothetical protein